MEDSYRTWCGKGRDIVRGTHTIRSPSNQEHFPASQTRNLTSKVNCLQPVTRAPARASSADDNHRTDRRGTMRLLDARVDARAHPERNQLSQTSSHTIA